jgi:hypothetical protein
MRIDLKKTAEQVRAARRDAYLAAWPLDRQAEALQDAANGRPEKLAMMNADFGLIKAGLPWPEGE